MVRLTKYRRGRYRQTKDVELPRRRAMAKEAERAEKVKAALRERLDPESRRAQYDADGRFVDDLDR